MDGLTIRLPVTQEQIGDAIGLSPVHVSRVFKELRLKGLIRTEGRTLIVRSWSGLVETGEFEPRLSPPQERADPVGASRGRFKGEVTTIPAPPGLAPCMDTNVDPLPSSCPVCAMCSAPGLLCEETWLLLAGPTEGSERACGAAQHAPPSHHGDVR
jgi:hypothetical protein